ncbi:hypothetical protein LCGC14_2094810 [marine sediment metagenome]|uniref:Uncharacterized protein n=1 Tax=marine sediment metagenome TaxID=412755 RepID=A0A0F9EZ03_9ZZZZ
MRILKLAILLVVVLLLAQGVWAQGHYVKVSIEVPVDAGVGSDLVAAPDPDRGIDICPDPSMGDICLTAEALPPGGQAGYDITIQNMSMKTCKDVFPSQVSMSPGLFLQTWPVEDLVSQESAVVRVIITVSEEAEDMTTLSMGLGLICVR